jgi:phosphoribosylformylglycinamidine synthase
MQELVDGPAAGLPRPLRRRPVQPWPKWPSAAARARCATWPATDPLAALFAEELGAGPAGRRRRICERPGGLLEATGCRAGSRDRPRRRRRALRIVMRPKRVSPRRNRLRRLVGVDLSACRRCATTPDCAAQELTTELDADDPGMQLRTHEPDEPGCAVCRRRRPRMAILREQGVNGHVEMAAAFDAGRL